MDFGMKSWKTVFSEIDTSTIKVYMCGIMDFSPIQHAIFLNWKEGVECLIKHNIGANVQGCGLHSYQIDYNLFIKDYDEKYEMTN